MATIDDLRTLGYTIGIAHGSVAVEEQALADANAAADPNVVAAQAADVTAETVKTLDQVGKLPDTPEARLQLASEIAAAALEQLTERVTDRVAFHERALEIARTSPDVWVVQHIVDVDGTDRQCVQVYVAANADGTGWDDAQQALIDALADANAYAARTAAVSLAAAGTLVTLGEDGALTLDGDPATLKQVVAAADALP